MTKQEIIDYVMNSPANSNRAVLKGMLDSVAEASGGRLRVNIASSDQTEGTITYDKTWQEVHDALESGMDVTYQYPNGMYFRIFAAQSFPHLGYAIMAEVLKSVDTTPTLVADGTVFTTLSSPDDYLIAQGSSGSGSGTTPPIGQAQ